MKNVYDEVIVHDYSKVELCLMDEIFLPGFDEPMSVEYAIYRHTEVIAKMKENDQIKLELYALMYFVRMENERNNWNKTGDTMVGDSTIWSSLCNRLSKL